MGSVVEFTKGWLGVQPGPRIFLLSSGRIGIPDEKNDCERTRKQWTVISKPSSPADQRQPCQSHGSGKSEDWVGGLCPPDPPRFTALFQARRANKNGTPCGIPSPILAPSRRSGRVSASPYPPLGSLTSVLLGGPRNQTECARRAVWPDTSFHRPKFLSDGPTSDVLEVDPRRLRSSYAILERRFSRICPFRDGNAKNRSRRRSRPALTPPSTGLPPNVVPTSWKNLQKIPCHVLTPTPLSGRASHSSSPAHRAG